MSSSKQAILTPYLFAFACFATISIATFARYKLVPTPQVAVIPAFSYISWITVVASVLAFIW